MEAVRESEPTGVGVAVKTHRSRERDENNGTIGGHK